MKEDNGQKPDDARDGRGLKTLACYDPSRHTTKCSKRRIGENKHYRQHYVISTGYTVNNAGM